MKTFRELASAFSIKPMMTAILAPLEVNEIPVELPRDWNNG